jgi:hypothetical protein
VCATLGSGEIEWRQPPTSQLSEPGDLTRSRQHHDLHRLCLGGALELRGRDRRLEENHGVRRTAEIALGCANVRVVIVVAEGAESLLCALERRTIARYYDG